ncbi:hypothetical protein D9M68_354620 [compost metagenome]
MAGRTRRGERASKMVARGRAASNTKRRLQVASALPLLLIADERGHHTPVRGHLAEDVVQREHATQRIPIGHAQPPHAVRQHQLHGIVDARLPRKS